MGAGVFRNASLRLLVLADPRRGLMMTTVSQAPLAGDAGAGRISDHAAREQTDGTRDDCARNGAQRRISRPLLRPGNGWRKRARSSAATDSISPTR